MRGYLAIRSIDRLKVLAWGCSLTLLPPRRPAASPDSLHGGGMWWRKRSRTAAPARACAKAPPSDGLPPRPVAQEVAPPPGEVKGWTITDGQPVASADAALQPQAYGQPRTPASASSPTSKVCLARCTARVSDSHSYKLANSHCDAACDSLAAPAHCTSVKMRSLRLTLQRARSNRVRRPH